jgi:hypothetical protein
MELIALALPSPPFEGISKSYPVSAGTLCPASLNGAIFAFADWWHNTVSLFTTQSGALMSFALEQSNPMIDEQLGRVILKYYHVYEDFEADALGLNPGNTRLCLRVDELPVPRES